jgi:hypothetical protein
MNEMSPDENLQRVLKEFDDELQLLLSQQALTKIDVQKIRNQAEISKDAMITARDEPSFNDRARSKLLNALIRDFEKSIQKMLDDAIGRRGDRALLVYRLNKVDKKLSAEAAKLKLSSSDLHELQFGLALLKNYILGSIPEKTAMWGSSKIDVGAIVKIYERTIREQIPSDVKQIRILGD